MALNPLVDSRDVRFVLFEMIQLDKISEKFPQYADYDRETYEDFLELAERIAVEHVYPANAEGDKEGCKYDPKTKEVRIPEAYKVPIDAFYEAGFLGIPDDPEIGGMGMPQALSIACNETFNAASVPLMMYPGLTHGAMLLISNHGTEEQKSLYIEKMMSGKWGGTMCLTEPDAGSDVGALTTKAIRQDDGTFLIQGQKIFISVGDNDYYENIIHPVLARIEGDLPGTKGISMFIVPKHRINPDGSIGEHNDVECAGIEHKMGIHGSSTCTLAFGDNGKCTGYLLGQEQKGMRIMFQMMNEARLGVGLQGLSIASSAYMHAVTYAKNRIQSRHATQMLNPEAKGVPIVQHPDVKRMLLWMKSHVEGMRAFTYYLAHCLNIEEVGEGEEQKEGIALSELLRPICKAGNTDTSMLVSFQATQVYGGYGYISEYPVEQLMRDSVITTIYEGTNGIQSADLITRKILMNEDQYNYNVFKKKVAETIARAKGIVDDKYITPIEKGIDKLDEVIEMLKDQMAEMKILDILMNATPLQQAMHMLVLSWFHLWALTIALPKMKELIGDTVGDDKEKLLEDNAEAAYYYGRVLSAQFYIGSEFQKYFGRIDSLLSEEDAITSASDPIFTGALEE